MATPSATSSIPPPPTFDEVQKTLTKTSSKPASIFSSDDFLYNFLSNCSHCQRIVSMNKEPSFQCEQCPQGFGVCAECKPLMATHHPSAHVFSQKPLDHWAREAYGYFHLDVKCDSCSARHFNGNRRQCEECPVTYDLCDKCFGKKHIEHQMKYIQNPLLYNNNRRALARRTIALAEKSNDGDLNWRDSSTGWTKSDAELVDQQAKQEQANYYNRLQQIRDNDKEFAKQLLYDTQRRIQDTFSDGWSRLASIFKMLKTIDYERIKQGQSRDPILRFERIKLEEKSTRINAYKYVLVQTEISLCDRGSSSVLRNTKTKLNSPTGHVGVNVTWTFEVGNITRIHMAIYKMQPAQWAAIGLNRNQSMAPAHVFVCRRLANGTIDVNRYMNPGMHLHPVPAGIAQGGVFTAEKATFDAGVVICQFTLSNFTTMEMTNSNDVPILSQSTLYHPLVAIGPLNATNSMKEHGIDSHKALPQLVQLNRSEIVTYHLESSKVNISNYF
ncbi:unnamed protein product [Adineta ricciae]|uniref:ZZ-type domain-containing protein n=1 Tax=Adineta ricciae TaxID=249248 RepID=A0A815MBY7_ADIRI|nr:unnamed protein product [Adineta ricciae]